MNPASRIWDIPPPPGTEDDELLPLNPIKKEKSPSPIPKCEPEIQTSEEKPEITVKQELIDTLIIKKEPEEVSTTVSTSEPIVKKEREQERGLHRSNSGSPIRSKDKYRRRRRTRSRSRERHRRSRSRRRKKRYSSSRSRSRTPSYRRRRRSRHKYSSSRYSRSRSRSKSRSPRYRHKSYRSRKDRDRSHRSRSFSPRHSTEGLPLDADTNEVDMKIEEEEEEEDSMKDNVFKNDGSFLEMFKKMQEQQQKSQAAPAAEEIKKPVLPTFGKRRGGKVLKTGMVQKVRQSTEEESGTDAWSVYMKEVRRYKEACCDDDSKTRPLVK